MTRPPYYMVFDVESVGLFGKAFAVGWTVVNQSGELQDEGIAVCPLDTVLEGSAEGDVDWVSRHVLPALDCVSTRQYVRNPVELATTFWSIWLYWRERGAMLVADVPWPVEARFLFGITRIRMMDSSEAPYPILDVASIRLAKGLDPLATEPRIARELPAHNPLCDARQSARLLLEALAR